MHDQAATRLELSIEAFRAIAAAVTEAEIGGEVPAVTITEFGPDLQLMQDAIGVELTVVQGAGASDHLETWIVAGDGRVIAHLQDPPPAPERD
jgi:hypothetical protein